MIKAVLAMAVLTLVGGCKSEQPRPVPALITLVTITSARTVKQLPPTIVHIRGTPWEIRNDPSMENQGYDGQTDCGLHLIRVDYNVSEAELREVVIHELLHAGTCKDDSVDNRFWNSVDQDKHRGIYRLGIYEAELLKANPELTLYLAGLTSK